MQAVIIAVILSLQLESCILISNRKKYLRFHVKGRCHKHPEGGGRGGVCTGSSTLRESFENRFVCISPVKNPFENRFVCIFPVKNPFENRFVCILPVKNPFENPFGSRFTLWPTLQSGGQDHVLSQADALNKNYHFVTSVTYFGHQ